MNFVTKLSTAVVVERSGIEGLKSDALTTTLSEIYGHGIPVKIVDNATQFFSAKNLAAVLDDESKHSDLPLILEKRMIPLSDDEIELIKSYQALKRKILSSASITADNYNFADVPEGWSLEKNLKISAKNVSRPGHRHTIGIKTLERIWKSAASVWMEISTDTVVNGIQASGHYNDAIIRKNSIKIGFQEIQRYEIEQLALHLGWGFPKEG